MIRKSPGSFCSFRCGGTPLLSDDEKSLCSVVNGNGLMCAILSEARRGTGCRDAIANTR